MIIFFLNFYNIEERYFFAGHTAIQKFSLSFKGIPLAIIEIKQKIPRKFYFASSLAYLAGEYIFSSGGYKKKRNKITNKDDCMVFSVHEKEWKTLPRLNTARHSHSSCVLDSKMIYTFLGLTAKL